MIEDKRTEEEKIREWIREETDQPLKDALKAAGQTGRKCKGCGAAMIIDQDGRGVDCSCGCER